MREQHGMKITDSMTAEIDVVGFKKMTYVFEHLETPVDGNFDGVVRITCLNSKMEFKWVADKRWSTGVSILNTIQWAKQMALADYTAASMHGAG
jgi:hypothetical protein